MTRLLILLTLLPVTIYAAATLTQKDVSWALSLSLSLSLSLPLSSSPRIASSWMGCAMAMAKAIHPFNTTVKLSSFSLIISQLRFPITIRSLVRVCSVRSLSCNTSFFFLTSLSRASNVTGFVYHQFLDYRLTWWVRLLITRKLCAISCTFWFSSRGLYWYRNVFFLFRSHFLCFSPLLSSLPPNQENLNERFRFLSTMKRVPQGSINLH